jgi:hypothetical protein
MQDRLSPDVKRDVYFSDLAYMRRRAVRSALFAVLTAAAFIVTVLTPELRRTPSILGLLGLVFSIRSIRDWRTMRADADGDADLRSDPRLATEDRRSPLMSALTTAVTVSQVVTAALLLGLVLIGLGYKL